MVDILTLKEALGNDSISVYLFLMTLRILFLCLKKHSEIKVIGIFEHCSFYTTYVDDKTPFLKDSQSTAHLVEFFKIHL